MQLHALMSTTLQFEEREPDDPCPYLLAICRTGKEVLVDAYYECHLLIMHLS